MKKVSLEFPPSYIACTMNRNFVKGIARMNYKADGPPMLLSFPGSGNTWLRVLIDYATGE